VELQKKFIEDVAQLRSYSKKYDGPDCKVPLIVDPDILGDNTKTVVVCYLGFKYQICHKDQLSHQGCHKPDMSLHISTLTGT
jgi:hypothetical protein